MARCLLCNNLEKKGEDDFRLAFDFAPEHLIPAKESQNCASCALILNGILRFEDDTWKFAKDVSRVYVYALGVDSDSLTLEIYFKADRQKLMLEFFYLEGGDQRGRSPGWKAIRPRNSVTGYPVLLNGLRWIDTVLQTCLTKHTSCGSIKNNLLPKRLLLFKRFASGEINVRIQENQGQKGRYNALSYCWGSSQTFVTTLKTITDYKNAIPWTLLPTTFRDGIVVSLELGVNYLWIDALCIVQDDPSDWEVESAKMADIYQNAFMTLAATTSSSGTEGCFSVNHAPVREYNLDSSALHPQLSSIRVREKVKHWSVPPTNHSKQSYPLLSRGWAFQERHLSPRVLHFCRQELVWECIEETLCECGGISAVKEPQKRLLSVISNIKDNSGEEEGAKLPRGQINSSNKIINLSEEELDLGLEEDVSITNSKFVSQKTRTRSQKLGALANRLLRRNAANYRVAEASSSLSSSKIVDASSSVTKLRNLKPLSEQWHSIVEQYSALMLTRETDRLPALSGLAERASPLLGQYLCGLWIDTLVSDLLWRVNTLEYDHGRPTKYTGPSWSWASIKGPVSYWLDLDNSHEENEALRRLESYSTSLDNTYDKMKALREYQYTKDLVLSLKRKAEIVSFTYSVKIAGQNPFGEVSPGFIKMRGYIREAALKYIFTRAGYGSEVTHDPLKYQVAIGVDTYLSFFADYVLSAAGPNELGDLSPIYLLLVHPYICLVLRRKQRSEYERVGIIKQPSALPLLYGLNWMESSVLTTVRIF